MAFKPLNPALYRQLRRHYGDVEVNDPGTAFACTYEPETYGGGELRLRVETPGEEYKIDCPFCGDRRHRLTINHRWGVRDKTTGYLNLFLMRCYNEECQDNVINRQHLYDILYRSNSCEIDEGHILVGITHEAGPSEIDPPGPLVSLEHLKRTNPHHHAIQYLESRLYDPIKLSRQYQVSYCPESRQPLARDRIIIPLYEDGKLMGWQARYIGEWRKGMPPKYFTGKGTKRRYLLYNYEQAIKHQTVVVVEGPTDVWGFGPQAIGCWGKSMSEQNRNRLIGDLPPDSSVVIMLDPKQDPDEARRNRPHHIEKLYRQLWPSLKGRLLRVYLPDENSDPGSLDRKYMRDLIRREAKRQSVRVDFSRPKE